MIEYWTRMCIRKLIFVIFISSYYSDFFFFPVKERVGCQFCELERTTLSCLLWSWIKTYSSESCNSVAWEIYTHPPEWQYCKPGSILFFAIIHPCKIQRWHLCMDTLHCIDLSFVTLKFPIMINKLLMDHAHLTQFCIEHLESVKCFGAWLLTVKVRQWGDTGISQRWVWYRPLVRCEEKAEE